MKVGRAALDEDAIRLLEELNPDVEFDWTRILKAEPLAPEARPGPQRRPMDSARSRPGRGDARRPSGRAPSPAAPRSPGPDPNATPVIPIQRSVDDDERVEIAPDAEPGQLEAIPGGSGEMPPLPSSLLPPPAHERLGTEGVVRLRARYAEVLARISERIADPTRKDELKSEAERLNPDSWVTDDEVRAGLEQYEAVFESLRAVVGRRRRRRRRGQRPEGGSTAGQAAHTDEPGADGPESGLKVEGVDYRNDEEG